MKKDDIKRSPEDWLVLIQKWQESNMSAQSWCINRNIPYKRFIYWRTRLKNTCCPTPQTPSSSFVELSDNNSTLSGIEIHYHNFSLKLQKDFDSSALLSCLQVMEKL